MTDPAIPDGKVKAVLDWVGRTARLDIPTLLNFDVDYGFPGGCDRTEEATRPRAVQNVHLVNA